MPIVTIDRPVPDCPGVLTDNYAAARKAAAHLVAHGYRCILCYTREPHLHTIHERTRGYSDEMEQAGIAARIDASFNENAVDAEVTLAKYLRSPSAPDAIFILKNSATIATFQILQRLRIAVPGKVALLGFDDFLLAGTVKPSISVVQQSIYEVGRTAAELLFERLQRARIGPRARTQLKVKPIILQCTIVPRASCGCRALQSAAPGEHASRLSEEIAATVLRTSRNQVSSSSRPVSRLYKQSGLCA